MGFQIDTSRNLHRRVVFAHIVVFAITSIAPKYLNRNDKSKCVNSIKEQAANGFASDLLNHMLFFQAFVYKEMEEYA